MDLTGLQTAIAGNVLASGVLAFAFFYLWLQRRQTQAPIFWGAAYLCYCVRQVLILIYAPGGPPLVADLLFIAVPLLILAGTLLYLGRNVPYRLLAVAAAVFTLGAMAGYSGVVSRQAVWLPAMLGAGTITLFVTGGLLLLHNRQRPEPAHVILAVLFILWGTLLTTFPLLLHSMSLRVGYYFANAVVLLSLALVLIIASQRQQYRAAEDANQRFQDVVDTATAWIWEWDTERRIRFISPQVYDSLGIKPELFIGRRFRDVPGIARLDLTLADANRIFTTDGPFRNVPIDVVTTTGKRTRISVTGKPTFDAAGRHTGFRGITIDITETSRMQATLEAVTAAVAGSVGPDYFRLLVERLVRTLGADTALVGRQIAGNRIASLAAYGDGSHRADVEYALEDTPCAKTLADGLFIVERDASGLFPRDDILIEQGFQGYAGVALRGADGEPIGLIALLTRAPLPDAEQLRAVLIAIAPRAGAELERQIAEAALRDSEARFRALIDNMPIGYYLVDSAGRFIQRNRTLEAWSGAETSDYLGKTVREAAGNRAADYAEAEAEIQEVLATGRTIVREREFHGLNGKRRPALIIRFPIVDSAGRTTFVATFINDLTNVKHLEAQVRESEELFRTIVDHMPIGFHLTDVEGRFVMRNRAIDEWTGLDRSVAIGRTHRDVGDRLPSDYAPIQAALRDVVETGRPVVQERTERHADGRERPLLINRYPIFDKNGAVRFVATLLTDLADVKRLETQVREREKLFRTVIDNTPMAFQITDPDGRMVLANRTLQEWHGRDEASLIGRTFRENGHSAAACARIEEETRQVLATGETRIYEGIFESPGSPTRPALVCRFPIVDSTGTRSLIGSVIIDLSDRKQLQRQIHEGEQLLNTLIENMPIGLLLADAQHRVIRRNRTLESWSQRDSLPVLGQIPDDPDILADFRRVTETREPLVRERQLEVANGPPRPVLVTRVPIIDAGGTLTHIASLVTDLTDVKQLQHKVEERERLLRAILDNMPIAFYLTDAEGRFVLRNRTLSSWSGDSWDPRPGNSLREIATSLPFDPSNAEAELREVRETGRPVIRERNFMSGSPFERPTLVSHFPIRDAAGRLAFVGSLATDLSDLRRLETQVREREALFRTVIDNMPVALHLTDADGRVVQRNRTHDIWGNEIVLGQRFGEMNEINITPEDRAIVDAEIRQVRETGHTLVRERIDLVHGGQQRPVLVCRFPIFDAAGKVTLVASMVTDVSELKRLEDEVRRSEARLQRIVAALDRSQKGVVVEDVGNRPIYVNRTASELMGNESSALAMLERAGIGSEFESHGAWAGEVIHRTRSGNDAILQASISRLPDGGSVTLLDDATERLERERRQIALERQVQEAQKMDAVGQLAGGIAHDFNNLIGAILGFARFIAEDTEETSPIHGYAARILSASQRARDLIQQILSFSRRENAPRQPTAITTLVEESAQLLRATVPATLDIVVHNDFPEAWSIANQTQITQILVNLCLNAADAMAGRPGTLVLALERLPDVDPRLRWLLASDPGSLPRVDAAAGPGQASRCFVGALRTGVPYLVLSVRDEGPGIPAEQLARIFDPFFTTKPRGQGTGLGLSVVQRLVLAHDGAIVVTTRLGTGTTFDIILPVSGRSSRDIVEAVTRDDPAKARPAAASARARVLVVDDDQHFGDMVSTALDRAGYEVGVCGRPREAIEVFGQAPEHWDVLVTDQTMPEMSGLELIGRLKSLHPGLRCILCTGYAVGGLNAASARAGGADAFFNKPVDVEALMTSIAGLTAPTTAPRSPGNIA